jgi:hypothetical protein
LTGSIGTSRLARTTVTFPSLGWTIVEVISLVIAYPTTPVTVQQV